jgi:hypothetical protein
MTDALDPITELPVHVSQATPGKPYKCEHGKRRVFASVYPSGLAFCHSTYNSCIGILTPRCESWAPPPGYKRPAREDGRA